MARKKSKFVEEVEDLNLVPIMNLVLCLIPLVLFKWRVLDDPDRLYERSRSRRNHRAFYVLVPQA